ncbi:hypothetical protein PAPHI01_0726 [Pancytospora philotis]|nr:hypothetical protein PAPHI01_0726 [Pancytospora philotis]
MLVDEKAGILKAKNAAASDASEDSGEEELLVPSLNSKDCFFIPSPTTHIGDFSNNSFIFTGREIIRRDRDEPPREAGREAGSLVHLIATENGAMPADAKALDQKEFKRLLEDDAVCAAPSMALPASAPASETRDGHCPEVYMRTAIELFQSLNLKLSKLERTKQQERAALDACYKNILCNNIRAAVDNIKPHVSAELSANDAAAAVLASFTSAVWPGCVAALQSDLLSVREAAVGMRELFHRVCAQAAAKESENCRLKDIIKEQCQEHAVQMDSLVTENNLLKDGMIEVLRRHGPEDALESMLQEDLLQNVNKIANEQAARILELRKEVMASSLELETLRKRESSTDVATLTRQIEDHKGAVRRLQAENISFSEAVQKLSEKNIRYKNDLILFNTELKKAFDVIKSKNETVARQRSLINLFQEKMTGADYPLAALRERRRRLELQIEDEKDYFKKENLRKEWHDCERRLNDFTQLLSQHNRRI